MSLQAICDTCGNPIDSSVLAIEASVMAIGRIATPAAESRGQYVKHFHATSECFPLALPQGPQSAPRPAPSVTE